MSEEGMRFVKVHPAWVARNKVWPGGPLQDSEGLGWSHKIGGTYGSLYFGQYGWGSLSSLDPLELMGMRIEICGRGEDYLVFSKEQAKDLAEAILAYSDEMIPGSPE